MHEMSVIIGDCIIALGAKLGGLLREGVEEGRLAVYFQIPNLLIHCITPHITPSNTP
jgi:hypothetical protein